MQRQAPSIRHRGGTSGTFPQHCRLTDGSATDMKTSEGLSLPAYPCSRLGGQWLIKINGCMEWKREKLDRQALKFTLMCWEVTLKFVVRVVFAQCSKGASTLNILNSLSMQLSWDCKDPKRTSSYTATESSLRIDEIVDTVVHAELHGNNIMENNIDLMLQFFFN